MSDAAKDVGDQAEGRGADDVAGKAKAAGDGVADKAKESASKVTGKDA